MVKNWTLRQRPTRLERRIEFDNYELVREFLDLTAALSEREKFYPDLSFGRSHASMTIHAAEGSEELDELRLRFAEEVNRFAPTNHISAPIDADIPSK